MTKNEKESIFNLLKKADSYINGYIREEFLTTPDFSDDTEAPNKAAEPQEVNQVITKEISDVKMVSPNSEYKASQDSELHGLSIDDLNKKILRCTRCGLARTRNNVVPGQGVSNPDVLIIGEGPGYDEDMQGLPFVGKAGVLLDKMLAAIKLDRKTNCYIANIVKCRPPENRDPFPDEQAACISFLEAQIHILKPKMILCMGRIAGHKMLKIETPMNQLHGQIFDYNGIPLMVTYHPSALLRNEELKRPAWHDLQLFRKKLDEIKQL